MTWTARRLTFLVAFHASAVVAALVALLAPERGGRLVGLGVCAALLCAHVDRIARIASGPGDDRTRGPYPASRTLRIRDALDSAQPALLGTASALVLLIRDPDGWVIVIGASALLLAATLERTDSRARTAPRTATTAAATWSARGPHQATDLTYALLLIAVGALVVVLPDDPGTVRAAAGGAVVVLVVAASAERRTGRRLAMISS
jgi:hypothetical protein